MRRSDELHDITEGGSGANGGQLCEGVLFDFDSLCGATDGEDLNNLIEGVGQSTDDQETIQEINGDTVGRFHVGATDLAVTSVGGKNNDGGKVAFKGSVEVGETFDIEHMDLIDEEHTWHKLSNTVINVLINDLVDFKTKLFGDFSFLGSVNLTH